MICPKCGANNLEGASSCVNCGVPFVQNPQFQQAPRFYCKNCGNPMDANATVCMHCGFAKGTGKSFCPGCGSAVQPQQAVCLQCGSSLSAAFNPAAKSKMVAGLLGIFLGSLGIHNFYLGFTKKAVIQLVVSLVGGMVTCGLAAIGIEIWALVEGIFYLIGKEGYTTDSTGMPLKD